MASKKTLAQRLFSIYKTSSKNLTNCRWIPNRASLAPDPGDSAIFSRFLHKRAIQPATSPELRSFLTGESLIEKIKEIGIARDRLRLDGLTPPKERSELTALDTRKLLRAVQLETVKSRLREIQKTWIPYSEFVRICGEGSTIPDQGRSFAKMLDDSGSVVVLGDVVFLRPEQENKTLLFRQILTC